MYFFFLLSPFHVTLVPWAKGILMSNWQANEETRNIPSWPRETGNLPAPASGSVIKAVFEMSQKMPLLSCILHLWVVGNINLPGVRNKKELTVILWKGLFTHANHASTVCITYRKILNWTKGVLTLSGSYLELNYCGRLREHAWHTENTKIITWWKKREPPGKHTEMKLMYFELEGEKDTEEAPGSHFVCFKHLCICLMMCNFSLCVKYSSMFVLVSACKFSAKSCSRAVHHDTCIQTFATNNSSRCSQ